MNTNQKIAQPIKRQQARLDLLREAKVTCNSMPPQGNYYVDRGAYGVVTGTIRKTLGHGKDKDSLELGRIYHLKLLSFLFDRTIITSKIGDGLGEVKPYEAFGILKWAQPAKLSDTSPWTCAPHVSLTCIAFEIEHLGQLEMEI